MCLNYFYELSETCPNNELFCTVPYVLLVLLLLLLLSLVVVVIIATCCLCDSGYYEYTVVPKKSSSTDLIGATGECLLAFTPQKYLVCAHQNSKQVFGVWPYGCLRKYWGDKEGFGFICGRRAPRGEGEFRFQTVQGEDIFCVLERLIKVVSARPQEVPVLSSVPPNISRGMSTHRNSLSDEKPATGVDSRPQQPLPPHMYTKQPELRKRLSLAEPLPPIPDQDQASKSNTLPSRAPVVRNATSPSLQYQQQQEQVMASNTVFSDTSPAYFISTTSKPPQLHPKQSPPSQGTVPDIPPERRAPYPLPSASPPVSPTWSNNQEEDTYSHTSHEVPIQFTTRNASFKMVRGSNIYHGLMRSDSLGSKTDRMRRQSNNSGSYDDNAMAMYDLAYRPSIQNPRELVPVREGEYESIGDAARQLQQLKERNLAGSPGNKHRDTIDGMSFGEKLRQGEDAVNKGTEICPTHQLHDGQSVNADSASNGAGGSQDACLMNNPMYGSRENILADCITDTASSIERERAISNGSGEPAAEGRQTTPPNDMERSMVMNPTYSECTPRQYYPKPHKPSRLGPEDHGSILPGMGIGGGNQTFDEPLSPLEDSMVDNPMYGGRSDLVGIGSLNAASMPTSPDSAQLGNSHTETDRDNTHDTLNEDSHVEKQTTGDNPPNLPSRLPSNSPTVPQNLGSSPGSPTHKPIPIVRSDKGYTKIDKLPGTNGEDNSPPPPLPPRLYSDSSA